MGATSDLQVRSDGSLDSCAGVSRRKKWVDHGLFVRGSKQKLMNVSEKRDVSRLATVCVAEQDGGCRSQSRSTGGCPHLGGKPCVQCPKTLSGVLGGAVGYTRCCSPVLW